MRRERGVEEVRTRPPPYASFRIMPSSSPTPSSPESIRPSAGVCRTLYVDTIGAVVRRRQSHFVVDRHTDNGTERITSVPTAEVDAVALVGRVHCTMPALRLCLREGIPVVFLSRYGKVKGYLAPPHPTAHVAIRRAQHAAQHDTERRGAVARSIVGAKLHNMAHRLQRTQRRRPSNEVAMAIENIDRLACRVFRADTLDVLLGLEGAATNAYFSAWPDLIQRPEPALQFTRRTRRPSRSAVDALLGFTYSLLQKDVHAACVIAGLDPSLGLLHESRPYAPSAVLDLMEAFRPVVADSVVLALLNRGTVQPDHFETRDGGVFLKKEGRIRVYRAYGRRRADAVTVPGSETSLPYYRVFEHQARQLARALTGHAETYRAFRAR